jgi:bifunctional ADP-heptose synthase (sugar kinase/adenylyltransferase)
VVGRWRDEADLEAEGAAAARELGLEALLVTRSEEGMTLFRRRRNGARPGPGARGL